MLKSLRLRDFKSFRNAELPLAPLTVMIGANASGKSNALEGLRLLSWIGQGNRLNTIRQQIGRQTLRGTVGSLGYRDAKRFELGCTTTDERWNDYSIGLAIDEFGELRIDHERLTGTGQKAPLYETMERGQGPSHDLRVAYNNFARGRRKPQVSCDNQMAVLSQLQGAVRFEAGHAEAQSVIPGVSEALQNLLGGIRLLDPQPAMMRGYSHKLERRLNEDGSNLSGVLHQLIDGSIGDIRRRGEITSYRTVYVTGRDAGLVEKGHVEGEFEPAGRSRFASMLRENRDVLLWLIRALPEQDINNIDFIETPRDEVLVRLHETFGRVEQAYDASVLSDGTLRVLSVGAAILSAPEGSLVVIEEIDNGVHPSRADGLLRSISDIAKARSLSVLISTHNPALLDALPNDAVPNVVFCYRDSEDGSSRLIRLDAIPDYPALMSRGSLGHLLTEGLIDRYAKHPESPDAKKRQFDEWLTRLRADAG